MDKKIVRELSDIVGEEYISTRADVLLAYSTSASMSYDPVLPGAVVRPGTTEEVAEILKVANKHKITVTPRSGGSSLQGEVIPQPGGLVVELMRLDEITLFENLRSVTVGAGITFGKLDKYLNKHDLWVPFYPGSSLVATFAGNVAVNGAGFGSGVFGCIAELVLGLEVVLPDGTIIQTGSEANPYAPGPFLRYSFGPDLTGLFIGSLGSYGIITKVALKTHKRMRYVDYNTYGFYEVENAEKFLLELKQKDVNAVWVAIYEGKILDFFLDMIGEEYGVPQHDWPKFTVSVAIGRIREDQLQSDMKEARNVCEQLGGHVIGIKELPKGEWEDRMRELARSSYVHGWHWRILYHHQTLINWHKSMEAIWAVMDEYSILGHTAGFQSGHASYNCYPQLYFDPQDREEEERIREAHRDLSQRLFKTGAVPFKLASYWTDGISEMDSYLRFLNQFKKNIDRLNILNPGIMPRPDGGKS
ncbi:MAG: FAD-binding oxidoreductase [Candidatus Thorarchaeota archaeon]